ncbi:sulfurtransferase [Paenarthrobacter nitroguajacolicus]|uniref:sulfurtransferase n=1 Tax=Paenarthrobacter nitroguajacolicus TaxID=211146 RepID=UPI00248BFCE4|nr:rhodanese-like domain-containing protein [Paenarthrobacter nitroguajacolicus]MDI2036275.1 putative thiosulfate sulfurtransferase SseB [Paenarthrobacter nitroguajacolicus]
MSTTSPPPATAAVQYDFRDEHFISAQDLAEQLSGGQPPVLLDVRFRPGLADPKAEYDAGHLPGAHYVPLSTVLADAGSHRPAADGALPLPEFTTLQRALRGFGINDDSRIVVYDNRHGLSAARAWWVLRWAGLADVKVLDGGYGYWKGQGLPSSISRPKSQTGTVTLKPFGPHGQGSLPTLSTKEAAVFAPAGVLIDAREAEHFSAISQGPATHIPGAYSSPSTTDLDHNGLLLPAEALRAKAVDAGLTSGAAVGTYCGAGVLAAHKVLTLATIGINASLYVGSWSAWSAATSAEQAARACN